MGDRRPITPDINGDESVLEPRFSNPSLLGAQRATDQTRRLETDADNNLFVNVAAGSLVPSGTQDVRLVASTITLPVSGPLTDAELRASPVPVTIPTPVPVTDNGGSLTVDTPQLPASLINGRLGVNSFNPLQTEAILTNATLTADGSASLTIDTQGKRDVVLLIAISGPVTGVNPTLQFSLFDIDPLTGSIMSQTQSMVYTTPIVTNMYLHFTLTGAMQINWFLTGTTPSFGGVNVTVTSMDGSTFRNSTGIEIGTATDPIRVDPTGTTAQPISGTVTANAGTGPFPVSDNGGSLTVDGTVSVSNFPATQTVAISQTGTNNNVDANLDTIVGTTIAVNAGVANAGTQRVVLASDIIVPTNVAAVGSNLIAVGSGVVTTGVQRVVLPTDQPPIPVTQSGLWSVFTTASPPSRKTYSASISGLVSAALGATDIFTITGSATQLIRVMYIGLSATRGTSANNDIFLLKRTTANSGGTSTTLVAATHDSTNAAATAVVRAYTANPTLGATNGSFIRTDKMFLNTVGTGATDHIIYEFGSVYAQPIVLRGTSEVLALNLANAIILTSSYDINITWTEE